MRLAAILKWGSYETNASATQAVTGGVFCKHDNLTEVLCFASMWYVGRDSVVSNLWRSLYSDLLRR